MAHALVVLEAFGDLGLRVARHGSKDYMCYGTSLYGRFLKQTSTSKMASKKTFHLR